MFASLFRLFRHLSNRRKLHLALLLGLMLTAAAAELGTLGAILPFLAVLTNPQLVAGKLGTLPLATWFAVNDDAALRVQLTACLIGAAAFAAVVRLSLVHVTGRVNFGIGHELGVEVYRRSLFQPYQVHVGRNSSEVLGAIAKVDEITFVLFGVLNMLSGILIGSCILAGLLFINYRVAAAVITVFGLTYALVSLLTQRVLAENGRTISSAYPERVQLVQEGLGGIRDLLLDHTQHVFVERFEAVDRAMRQAQRSNNTVGPSPRFIIEAVGIIVIALIALSLTREAGRLDSALPTLGALAIGGQRLMPLVQQAYQGWVGLVAGRHALVDVAVMLEQPVPVRSAQLSPPMAFTDAIRLENVCFDYAGSGRPVLVGLNLRIPRGARIGFVGATGSGKSTLVDVVMGLLRPTSGHVYIDGLELDGRLTQAWHRCLAHVPQAIYLIDASFSENIAFGRPREEIDMARVRTAAHQAQIADFIESSSAGYDTVVGERGVRLSGGQRQRIGLARALYKQASVLIFDEATSALDAETEAAVIKAIDGLGSNLTILMIAHRLATLRSCDLVCRLQGGRIVEAGDYDTICNSSIEKNPLHHA